MKQLTVKDIMELIDKLKKHGVPMSEILEIPIYLGDDDELNGIHGGWYCNYVAEKSLTDDDKYMLELISDNCSNPEFKHHAIIIS